MIPKLLGILNITEDSFSDGGRYLDPAAALAQAHRLAKEADGIDLGAASSRPGAVVVPPEVEIARLAPIVEALKRIAAPVCVDTFAPDVQRWALAQGVDYLNDVRGFPDETLYPQLAASPAKLIAMYSVEGAGPATRLFVPAGELLERISRFFEQRLGAFARAGIALERVILDPGMGLFLGSDSEASFTVLRQLKVLKARFGLPLLVSVSRKSFLRNLVHRPVAEIGPATLAAEYFAIRQGADYIRTHEPAALKDLLKVLETLGNEP